MIFSRFLATLTGAAASPVACAFRAGGAARFAYVRACVRVAVRDRVRESVLSRAYAMRERMRVALASAALADAQACVSVRPLVRLARSGRAS